MPGIMRAAVLSQPGPVATCPLELREIPVPQPMPHEALLKVLACGICRTDLHVVEGELPPKVPGIIPGHQVVAEVISSPDPRWQRGMRVGVAWIGSTDGTCSYCLSGRENLCDNPVFTGYTHNGGFAEYLTADSRFLIEIPSLISNTAAAPLLCAGIVGFRTLRIAEVKPGQRVGIFGFGASAQTIFSVLRYWGCEVYVSTRETQHQQRAKEMGASWVGGSDATPPVKLDAALTFAPAGDVVVQALRSLAKGGIVAINAIHLDHIPQFDYDSLLWGERQIRSVTNMTRQDAHDFMYIAAEIGLSPKVDIYPLDQINEALTRIREDAFSLPSVIVP